MTLIIFAKNADPRATSPSLRLVNKASLDKVLRAEIYVNPSDGQLRAAHLILGYTPISRTFQAPSCVIKARDPRLRRISVAYEGFLIPQGVPLPADTKHTEVLPVASLAGVSSPLPHVPQIKEEEEVERDEEGFVDVPSVADDYEVFNLLTPSPTASEDMGIQRKPQRSLQELLEGQPGRGEAGRSAQQKLPPPPPKSPLPAPQPAPPSRAEQPEPKRRREPKGKEVVETGRAPPSHDEDAQRPTKQLKLGPAPSRGPEMGEIQRNEPRAWLPAPMLGGEPLTEDASIRDYNGGIGCHVASALEETLLLPKDMVELRGLRRNEVFLQAKRCLGMVCTSTSSLIVLSIICFICILNFPFFLANRLSRAPSGWKRFTTPLLSSWRRREGEG